MKTKKMADNEVVIGKWKISSEYGIISSPNGKEFVLEPRLAKLMYLLSQNVNSIVSRHFLKEHIWKETIVNEESLTRAVADLRKVLSENFKNEMKIVTIPKRGYKLTFSSRRNLRTFRSRMNKPVKLAIYGFAMSGFLVFCITAMWYAGILKIVVMPLTP